MESSYLLIPIDESALHQREPREEEEDTGEEMGTPKRKILLPFNNDLMLEYEPSSFERRTYGELASPTSKSKLFKSTEYEFDRLVAIASSQKSSKLNEVKEVSDSDALEDSETESIELKNVKQEINFIKRTYPGKKRSSDSRRTLFDENTEPNDDSPKRKRDSPDSEELTLAKISPLTKKDLKKYESSNKKSGSEKIKKRKRSKKNESANEGVLSDREVEIPPKQRRNTGKKHIKTGEAEFAEDDKSPEYHTPKMDLHPAFTKEPSSSSKRKRNSAKKYTPETHNEKSPEYHTPTTELYGEQSSSSKKKIDSVRKQAMKNNPETTMTPIKKTKGQTFTSMKQEFKDKWLKSQPLKIGEASTSKVDTPMPKKDNKEQRTTVRKLRKPLVTDPIYKEPFKYGWKRELVYRKTVSSGTRGDVYYYTPEGVKLRSFKAIQQYVEGSRLTIDNFTFLKDSVGVDDTAKEVIRTSGQTTRSQRIQTRSRRMRNFTSKDKEETGVETSSHEENLIKDESNKNVNKSDTKESNTIADSTNDNQKKTKRFSVQKDERCIQEAAQIEDTDSHQDDHHVAQLSELHEDESAAIITEKENIIQLTTISSPVQNDDDGHGVEENIELAKIVPKSIENVDSCTSETLVQDDSKEIQCDSRHSNLMDKNRKSEFNELFQSFDSHPSQSDQMQDFSTTHDNIKLENTLDQHNIDSKSSVCRDDENIDTGTVTVSVDHVDQNEPKDPKCVPIDSELEQNLGSKNDGIVIPLNDGNLKVESPKSSSPNHDDSQSLLCRSRSKEKSDPQIVQTIAKTNDSPEVMQSTVVNDGSELTVITENVENNPINLELLREKANNYCERDDTEPKVEQKNTDEFSTNQATTENIELSEFLQFSAVNKETKSVEVTSAVDQNEMNIELDPEKKIHYDGVENSPNVKVATEMEIIPSTDTVSIGEKIESIEPVCLDNIDANKSMKESGSDIGQDLDDTVLTTATIEERCSSDMISEGSMDPSSINQNTTRLMDNVFDFRLSNSKVDSVDDFSADVNKVETSSPIESRNGVIEVSSTGGVISGKEENSTTDSFTSDSSSGSSSNSSSASEASGNSFSLEYEGDMIKSKTDTAPALLKNNTLETSKIKIPQIVMDGIELEEQSRGNAESHLEKFSSGIGSIGNVDSEKLSSGVSSMEIMTDTIESTVSMRTSTQNSFSSVQGEGSNVCLESAEHLIRMEAFKLKPHSSNLEKNCHKTTEQLQVPVSTENTEIKLIESSSTTETPSINVESEESLDKTKSVSDDSTNTNKSHEIVSQENITNVLTNPMIKSNQDILFNAQISHSSSLTQSVSGISTIEPNYVTSFQTATCKIVGFLDNHGDINQSNSSLGLSVEGLETLPQIYYDMDRKNYTVFRSSLPLIQRDVSQINLMSTAVNESDKQVQKNVTVPEDILETDCSFKCTQSEIEQLHMVLESDLQEDISKDSSRTLSVTENSIQNISNSETVDNIRENENFFESSSPIVADAIKPRHCESSSTAKRIKFSDSMSTTYPSVLSSFCVLYRSFKEIFSYLNVEDLLAVSKVCKLWAELANHSDLWRKVRITNSQLTPDLAKILKQHRTKHIIIVEENDLTWEKFIQSISIVESLQVLELCQCPSHIVEKVLRNCTHLLVISATAIKGDILDIDSVGKLNDPKKIELRSVNSMSLKGDLTFFCTFHTITHLSLRSIKNLGSKNIEVIQFLSCLQELELGECSEFCNTFGSTILSSLKNLERLRLEKVRGPVISADLLINISQLDKLNRLELVDIEITESFFQHLPKCQNLSDLLVIPNYNDHAAISNDMVLKSTTELNSNLKRFVWGITEQQLDFPKLSFQLLDGDSKNVSTSILSEELLEKLSNIDPDDFVPDKSRLTLRPLSDLQQYYAAVLPDTLVNILHIPVSATLNLGMS